MVAGIPCQRNTAEMHFFQYTHKFCVDTPTMESMASPGPLCPGSTLQQTNEHNLIEMCSTMLHAKLVLDMKHDSRFLCVLGVAACVRALVFVCQ